MRLKTEYKTYNFINKKGIKEIYPEFKVININKKFIERSILTFFRSQGITLMSFEKKIPVGYIIPFLANSIRKEARKEAIKLLKNMKI